MADKYLATYLNNHLADSVTGLELLVHLEEATAGTAVALVIAQVCTDIKEEQQKLEGNCKSRRARRARWWPGWRTKPRNSNYGWMMRLFETLEAIAVDCCQIASHSRLLSEPISRVHHELAKSSPVYTL